MSEKTLDIYINTLRDMIKKLELYTKDVHSFRDFSNNTEKLDACIVPLIQIGEIAGQMSKNFGNTLPLPYKHIIGFRNILVHMYDKINIEAVRYVIKKDIPKLKKLLQTYKK